MICTLPGEYNEGNGNQRQMQGNRIWNKTMAESHPSGNKHNGHALSGHGCPFPRWALRWVVMPNAVPPGAKCQIKQRPAIETRRFGGVVNQQAAETHCRCIDTAVALPVFATYTYRVPAALARWHRCWRTGSGALWPAFDHRLCTFPGCGCAPGCQPERHQRDSRRGPAFFPGR